MKNPQDIIFKNAGTVTLGVGAWRVQEGVAAAGTPGLGRLQQQLLKYVLLVVDVKVICYRTSQ